MSSSINSSTNIVVAIVILIVSVVIVLIKRDMYEKKYEVTPAQVEARRAEERSRARSLAEINSKAAKIIEEYESTSPATELNTNDGLTEKSGELTTYQENSVQALMQYSRCVGYFRFRAKLLIENGASVSDYVKWVERQERFERYRKQLFDDLGFQSLPDPAKAEEIRIYENLEKFRIENPVLAEKRILERVLWEPQCTEADREILEEIGSRR